MACTTYNGNFLISYSRFDGNNTSGTIPTHFATYSLANPLSPVEVGSVVDIQRSDSAGLYVAGNTALMYQSTTFYDATDSFIFQETGDIWTGDLTSAPANGAVNYLNDVYSCGGINATTGNCNNVTNVPAATFSGGVCTPNGTTPVPNDPNRGGPYRIGIGTAVNSTTTYFASTNANGGNIENPSCPQISGQLLVVDTSIPSNPAIVNSVSDPAMTFMSGIAIQGNLAIAVGDSTGIFSITSGYVGTLVVSAFDIGSPQSPVLTSSITTQLADSAGSFVVPLGMNTFAVGNTTLNHTAELVLIDASNPSALRYIPYNALFVANPAIAQNGYFFALSSTPASTINSLSAFQLSEITGPQLTVKLQLPNTNGVAVDPASFSLAPSSVTTGAAFDTYEWDQPAPNTITFNMNVTGVNPGDVPVVVAGGELDYTLPSLGAGKITFSQLTVLCQQILNISPASQSVSYGSLPATYMVTAGNPTSVSQTFVPSTLGIPSTWSVQAPPSVTVAAGGNQTFNLVLTPPLNTPPANYNFFAVLSTTGGITASVGAALNVFTTPSGSGGDPGTSLLTFIASLNPSTITLGQNGVGTFQLLITNTGNYANNISTGDGSPTFSTNPSFYNGWTLNFTPLPYAYVLPGVSNTATLIGTLTLPPYYLGGITPGSYPIVVQVSFGARIVNLTLTVNVVGYGVTGSINPGNGTPQTNFVLNLTNEGSAQDTYNLSVVGPLAQVASVPSTSGPINATKTGQVPITLNPIDFVSPGTYALDVKAVSQANPLVQAVIAGSVTVSGSKGVSAAITPSPTSVQTTPGSVSLLFQATNTGNVPDNYTASITGTTGPVTATLNGSGQSIASFPIPALGNSEFPLNAQVTGPGAATVTVTVTSLSSSTIHNQATVTINNSTAGQPTAIASPTAANTPVHRLAVLNASASSDPNNLPLTYLWTLTSAPAGSALNSGSISLANSALAAFRPDVLGVYSFNVNVSNGTASANATASYTAVDLPPVAVTANNYNTAVGSFAFLNGQNSYDPDGQPITFAWTLVSAPNGGAGSSSTSIYNSQTAHAFFTPNIAGAYQFQLIVTDPTASSLPALITVTAYSGAIPPNADAGPSQNIGVNATVTVNGSNSVDPNPSPLPLNYQWTLATVPTGSGATLSNATSAEAQFTPDVAGAYVASLVVSNANGTSGAATTTVYAYSGDVPPNANAGASQFVTPTSTVNLNSQASSDPDNGPLNLAFLWWLNSLPTGSTATVHQPNTATPTFVADKSGYYIGRVEANDGLLAGFANTLVTSAATCDADANGVINQTDIALITAAIGQTVLSNDPRDYDHTGTITQADVTACSALVSSAAPVLQVSPGSFTESLAQGSAAVAQLLQISSSGNPLSFTVSSNQAWLTASVTSDSTASISSLNAIVTPGVLTPNTYQGMLTFTPGTGTAQTVSVTLTITAAGTGLQVSPTSFTESLVAVSSAATQAVNVSSSSGPIGFTVSSNQPWLTTNIGSGSTSTVSGVNAIVNPAGLAPSTYQGTLTFTPSTGSVQTVSVTLTVTGSTGNGNKCDVNQDGVVNVLDGQLMVNEALGVLPANNDLNLDGVVNVVDIQIVLNAALNLGCSAH
jgi:hypothetical protein